MENFIEKGRNYGFIFILLNWNKAFRWNEIIFLKWNFVESWLLEISNNYS